MYYLNSRYYNSEIGHFINADGLIGQTGDILGHNMYAYAKNNPVMMIDPNGYSPWSWLEDRWNDTKEWVTEAYNDTKTGIKLATLGYMIMNSSNDGTYSIGVNLSAYFGYAGGGIQPFIISVDKKGNIAFQASAGLGEGSPSASAGISFTKTNAPTVFDLNGWGASIGGSIGEGGYVGIDGNTYIADMDTVLDPH